MRADTPGGAAGKTAGLQITTCLILHPVGGAVPSPLNLQRCRLLLLVLCPGCLLPRGHLRLRMVAPALPRTLHGCCLLPHPATPCRLLCEAAMGGRVTMNMKVEEVQTCSSLPACPRTRKCEQPAHSVDICPHPPASPQGLCQRDHSALALRTRGISNQTRYHTTHRKGLHSRLAGGPCCRGLSGGQSARGCMQHVQHCNTCAAGLCAMLPDARTDAAQQRTALALASAHSMS